MGAQDVIFGKKPCRRCLLEDMPSEAELAKTVREWIDALPPQLRAAPEVAARRLEACRTCDHLASGMCALCGCYVELRTAKIKMICPDLPARWS